MVSLDVIGDARVSNNLYVGGGVIITDKVNANAEVLTGSLKADSIKLDSTKAVYGYSIFKDKVKLENKLQVGGDVKVNGNFSVAGNFTFGSNNRSLGYLAPTASTPEILSWGITAVTAADIFANCQSTTAIPGTSYNQFMGLLQSFGNNLTPTGNYNVMTIGYDGANGVIDVKGDNTAGGTIHGVTGPDLLINYNCGKNVYVCTGPLGGYVSTGKNFEVGNPQRDENIAVNIYSSDKTGLFLTTDHSADFGYNTKLSVNRDLTRALSIYNTSTNTENFVVYGNGKVSIGGNYQHNNYMLAVNGTIIATELVVKVRGDWADYVFADNYKLLTYQELEAYLKANKHLPDMPSAQEVEDKGVNTSEMITKLLKQQEELTLYILEQNKRIEKLEQELKK